MKIIFKRKKLVVSFMGRVYFHSKQRDFSSTEKKGLILSEDNCIIEFLSTVTYLGVPVKRVNY